MKLREIIKSQINLTVFRFYELLSKLYEESSKTNTVTYNINEERLKVDLRNNSEDSL